MRKFLRSTAVIAILLLLAQFAIAQNKIVVFQSDFGLKDGAVSAMKGVANSVSTDLKLYDLTHEIPAYNIWEAAYRLEQTVNLLEDRQPLRRQTANKEALRVLNDRVNVLMERRRAEMDGRIPADSEARQRLREFKPIVDQFNFIGKVTTDIGKVSEPLHLALTAQQQEVGINPLF